MYSDEILNKSQDSYRQRMETESMKSNRSKDLLAMNLGSEIVKRLASLKCEAASVKAYSISDETDSKYSITYVVSMFHGGDNKTGSLVVAVADGVPESLDKVVTDENLQKMVGENVESVAKLKDEISKRLELLSAPIQPDVIVKEASAGPCAPTSYLAQTIHADKTWLPRSIKAGDFLFIGGAKYQVVDDLHGKLGSESDGALWTLRLVSEENTKKTDASHLVQ